MEARADADSVAPRRAADAAPIELAELDRGECLRLLAATRFGRIVVRTQDGAPAIRPVNYAFDIPSQSIVFRTGRGSKLHALTAAGHAAFEIDGTDADGQPAWSVIVSGVTEEILNTGEIARLADLAVEPWAPSGKPFLIRLRAFTVSGRRITSRGALT
ncbi:MAG: pyridoxamine 5'-phosphate oxidase family protein [Solirubrobacteraceae bacterium]|jgi:nitroimidazol reductase NimA-like FMN-containing flavoprotein (pyridoxamine 5'-phosphate oxidase superfamily)